MYKSRVQRPPIRAPRPSDQQRFAAPRLLAAAHGTASPPHSTWYRMGPQGSHGRTEHARGGGHHGASRGALPVDVADQGNCISSNPSPSLATLASAATPSKGDTHTHTDGSCSTARAPQTPRDSTSPRRMPM